MSETVYKPWGKEIWIEHNDKYCYKHIYINSGHRTSFQYHNIKTETNYIVKGKTEVWLEDIKTGKIIKSVMVKGDHFTVLPKQKHRIVAITDTILHEVSTPEIDDVIRISDDTNRKNGRIDSEHKTPAMCILAAGLGTRMGFYSKVINKGLLPVNNMAIISHMIDKTPYDYDIVIAVGYKKELIIEYCNAAHQDRNIVFIDVGKYEGEGTGPGTSMMMCKEYLQRPFYMAVSDCYIENDLPPIDTNWLGVSKTSLSHIYATVKIDKNNNIIDFKNKSDNGYDDAFIGICSILDYSTFWNELEKNIKDSGEMVSAFYNVNKYKNLVSRRFEWYDIGTIDGYLKTKKIFDKDILGIQKNIGQFVYKVNNRFVKLFSKKGTVVNITNRYKNISNLVPEMLWNGDYVFTYKWFNGDTLYSINDISIWKKFLEWSIYNLWDKNEYDILHDCKLFYKNKTLKRYKMFLDSKDDDYFYDEYTINGKKYRNIIEDIDYDSLYDGIPTKRYHGDFQFDNVLYNYDSNEFKLIDWRDSFGKSTEYGDAYYDLSKMYAGILMPFNLMKNKKNYSFNKTDNYVTYDFRKNKKLSQFKDHYERWIIKNGFDLTKIKKISSLIYLNISPLHHDGLDDVLFFNSIKMINENFGQ